MAKKTRVMGQVTGKMARWIFFYSLLLAFIVSYLVVTTTMKSRHMVESNALYHLTKALLEVSDKAIDFKNEESLPDQEALLARFKQSFEADLESFCQSYYAISLAQLKQIGAGSNSSDPVPGLLLSLHKRWADLLQFFRAPPLKEFGIELGADHSQLSDMAVKLFLKDLRSLINALVRLCDLKRAEIREHGVLYNQLRVAYLIILCSVLTGLYLLCEFSLFRPLKNLERHIQGIQLERGEEDPLKSKASFSFKYEWEAIAANLTEFAEKNRQINRVIFNKVQLLKAKQESLSASLIQLSSIQGLLFNPLEKLKTPLQLQREFFNCLFSSLNPFSNSLHQSSLTFKEKYLEKEGVQEKLNTIEELSRKNLPLLNQVQESGLAANISLAQIAEAVQSIEEIVEQTKQLALNAAIEAAKAGKAGSGFIVVANQVKTLAEQTHQAISGICDQVQSVANQAGHSYGKMQFMSQSLNQLQQAATSIVKAFKEHSLLAQQVNQSIDEEESLLAQLLLFIKQAQSLCAQLEQILQQMDEDMFAFTSQSVQMGVYFDELSTSIEELQLATNFNQALAIKSH